MADDIPLANLGEVQRGFAAKALGKGLTSGASGLRQGVTDASGFGKLETAFVVILHGPPSYML